MTEELDDFMRYLTRQHLGSATVSLYYGAVRRALEGIPAGRQLESILTDETLGASRRETYRKALFHWSSFVEDEALTERLRAWTPGRRPQRTKGQARALDIETEWPKLRRAILCHEDRFLAAVLYLIGTSGLRIAEVLNLKGKDIRTALRSGETIIEQKGLKPRLFALPTDDMQRQAVVLADELEDPETVERLLRAEGHRKSRKGIEDYIRRELQRIAASVSIAGKVTPHVCRRTVGDAVYESSNHDMRAVSEALGHDPGSRTTQRWYQDHIRPRAGADALRAALKGKDDDPDK